MKAKSKQREGAPLKTERFCFLSFHCHFCISCMSLFLKFLLTQALAACLLVYRLVSSSFLYLILFVFLSFRDQLDLYGLDMVYHWSCHGIGTCMLVTIMYSACMHIYCIHVHMYICLIFYFSSLFVSVICLQVVAAQTYIHHLLVINTLYG